MPRPPNILFIISDQHRCDATGCYGHPIVQTPNLDQLAADGVRFENAFSQSPLCVTSRAATLTGMHPHSCQSFTAKSFPLPELPTMGSVFRDGGYATGAFGKMHVLGETRERDLGFDERGMRIYTHWFEDYINEIGEEAADKYATYRKALPRFQTVYNPTNTPVELPDEQMYDHLVVERCIDFLTRHRDEPFLLHAGLDKPHTDWAAPARFHDMYDPAGVRLPTTVDESRTDMPWQWYASTRQSWSFDEDEIRRAIAAYYANVSYLDSKVGELLAALDRLGLRENTLVVYTTDHGEMCFEHGMVQKQNFFEGSVRVPLIFRHPGQTIAGHVPHRFGSLIDLLPTFADWCGLPIPVTVEGQSLAGALRGHPDSRPQCAYSEYYCFGIPERMVRTPEWKYTVSEGQPSQLYDMVNDPEERFNLAWEPKYKGIQLALHDQVCNGWERPCPETLAGNGAWNDLTPEQCRDYMEQWKRTRKRVRMRGE